MTQQNAPAAAPAHERHTGARQPQTEHQRRLSDAGRTLSALRVAAVACALLLAAYSLWAWVANMESTGLAAVNVLLGIFLAAVVYLYLNPDELRSQYAERTLSIASDMLEDMRAGLTREAAEAICHHLFSETGAMAISVTSKDCVLACVGDLAVDFPPGSPIHTRATRYALDHGIMQSFTRVLYVTGDSGKKREIPAGIVAPLKVRGEAVGALKFYYTSPRKIDRTQYALASGYAELISTQLAMHELEHQDELTARAEVRALQAQINPHFLFNTLNTIAAFTRTDPLRARDLLREFAAFYRATLDNSGSLIPVSRELAQTQRYLVFEKARFGEDRIVETIEVEEGAEDAPVPAFVIQPLVENAVRHAMRDEGPLHITVSVREDGEDAISITVADDGVGMDAQTASRLFNARKEAPDASAPQGGGAGVAMHNISERIMRFYGPRSSATVRSVPGEGTTVVLHLDLQGSIYA